MNTAMKIIYLQPRSAFTGEYRSDTLWGLICWGIRMIFSEKKLQDFLDTYKTENPALKVSSAFRYKEDDKRRVRFYPRPMGRPFNWEKADAGVSSKIEKIDLHKKIKGYKKIAYLEENNFISYLQGKLLEIDIINKYEKWEKNFSLAGSFKSGERLHNRIDRITGTTSEGALYSVEASFALNGGLFFLAEASDNWTEIIEPVLNFYNHFGFGGNSSTGYNHFKFKVEDFSFPEIPGANAFTTLSLYIPKDDELKILSSQLSQSAGSSAYPLWYEITERKGKAGGRFVNTKKFWKKSFFAFTEGSVFPDMKKPVYGKITEATLENSRELGFSPFQYGVAFTLPIKTAESK